MNSNEILEIQRRARQDAQAQAAGWPVPWTPYAQTDKIAIYRAAFDEAANELKKHKR